MLSWVVTSRPHPRLATLFRHVTKSRSPQVLLDSALTNGDAGNSFRIRSYGNCRVFLGLLAVPANAFWPISFPFTLLRTLLRLRKAQPLSFQANPNSFAKTPGGGVFCIPNEDQNERSRD